MGLDLKIGITAKNLPQTVIDQKQIERLYDRHFSCISDAIAYHTKESAYLRQLIQHHGEYRIRQIEERLDRGQSHQEIREWMGLHYSITYIGYLLLAARYLRHLPATVVHRQ